MGKEYFLRSGFRIPVLKESGKFPSVIQKLIKLVIGRRESIQDLRSLVGMRSRGHDELEDERMAARTSSGVAKQKCDREGGGGEGGGCMRD